MLTYDRLSSYVPHGGYHAVNSKRNEAENENSSISNDDFSHSQKKVASMMHEDRHARNNSL